MICDGKFNILFMIQVRVSIKVLNQQEHKSPVLGPSRIRSAQLEVRTQNERLKCLSNRDMEQQQQQWHEPVM